MTLQTNKKVSTKNREPSRLPTNCFSVFDHFVGLAVKGLTFHITLVHWRRYHFFVSEQCFRKGQWFCIQKMLPGKIWAVMKNLQEEQENALPVFHLFETCLLFWKLVFLFERVAKKYVCGSYFILNLSKQACNWKGKNFLILFHKLNLFEILRLHLQSVASVYLLEKNKCFERKPPPFHHTAVLFTLLDCKWNWSREWQRYRVTQVNDVCKLLKLRNDKN